MGRWFWFLLGCLAALFGTSLILPALAKLKHSGSLPADAVGALALGVAIVVVGLCMLAYGISRLLRPAKT